MTEKTERYVVDREAERRIVASLAYDGGNWRYVSRLSGADFGDAECRGVFDEMAKQVKAGRTWLDADYVEWVTKERPAFVSIELEELVKRVLDASACRRGMDIAKAVAVAAHALDADGVETALARRTEIPSRSTGGVTAAEVAAELYDIIGQDQKDVVPTGFPALDAHGAVRRREQIVLGARPSMGKSQLVFQIAAHVAERGGTVAVASLEMARIEVMARIAGARAGVPFRGDHNEMQSKALAQAMAFLTTMTNMVIFDQPMTTLDLWSEVRRMADRMGGVDLVIADHLRLFKDRANEERHRLGQISHNLRDLAKEIGCGVILCAQLSRGVEERDEKRPGLSDLRDSGEIEENADVVSFLYRDGYYQARKNGNRDQAGAAEVYADKVRNGPLWAARLWFDDRKGPGFFPIAKEPVEHRWQEEAER